MFKSINEQFRATQRRANMQAFMFEAATEDVLDVDPGADDAVEDVLDLDSIPADVIKQIDTKIDEILNSGKLAEADVEELIDDMDDDVEDDLLDDILSEAVSRVWG